MNAGGPLPGIVPDWPVPPSVRAFVTLRDGGTSTGPYGRPDGEGGLNLGDHVGDDPDAVRANRTRLEATLPGPVRWLRQVHGIDVHDADVDGPPTVGADGVPCADAAVTSRAGRVLAVLTADCLPILLADAGGGAVAIAHAGWRGLASGVAEAAVDALRTRIGPRGELLAWLGPAIGPRAFEVGDDVRRAFVDVRPADADAFVPGPVPGKWFADLYRLARGRLARRGVASIGGGDLCTVADPQRFYSHRRDRRGGRMASLVWIAR